MLHPDRADPFDRVDLGALRRRQSYKWRGVPPDAIALTIAEMDTVLADPIRAEIERLLAAGDTGYLSSDTCVAAFVDFALSRWGWQVDRELVRPVADVLTGISDVMDLLTRPGDAVVVTPPVHPGFAALARHGRRRVLDAPLGDDGRLDFAALSAAFAAARRAADRVLLVLCSPHNPTGVVHSRTELATLARLAARFRVRVVADEAHAPLTYPDSAFTPYLTVPGGDNGLAVISAAKAWNLAGFRSALVVAGRGSAVDIARIPDIATNRASGLGLAAQAAAFGDAVEWLDEHLDALDRRRTLLGSLIDSQLPGVGFRVPEASFLGWLDFSALALRAEPAPFFAANAGVLLAPGTRFGSGGSGHARLNFATSTDYLVEAVERMADSLRLRG